MSATPSTTGTAQPVYIVQPIVYARPARLKAAWSLALGILSLFVGFTIVPPVLGLVLGLVALKSEPGARGAAITGVILNGLVLLALIGAVVFAILMLVLAIAGQELSPATP